MEYGSELATKIYISSEELSTESNICSRIFMVKKKGLVLINKSKLFLLRVYFGPRARAGALRLIT